MDTKLYLTITAVVAILYGLAFLLIPEIFTQFFGNVAEPHAIMNIRFCGATALAWGLVVWFARDWDQNAVRGVLASAVVGLAINIIINIWGTIQGLLNSNSWGNTIVLLLLWLGAIYFLSTAKKPA